MSFRVIAKGHRFAIDGEVNAAVRREREQLGRSESGGGPLANRSLEILRQTVDELLKTAPHDSDVQVDLWGTREADGTGGLKLEVKFALAEPATAPITGKEALTEEHDDR